MTLTLHTIHQLAQHALTGKQMSALQQMLYHQIHQHYRIPPQAISMQEAGTTVVAFVLKPNGLASAISMKQSSGFPLLDQAAMLAIQKALPFNIKQFHMKKAHTFQIPIHFQVQDGV